MHFLHVIHWRLLAVSVLFVLVTSLPASSQKRSAFERREIGESSSYLKRQNDGSSTSSAAPSTDDKKANGTADTSTTEQPAVVNSSTANVTGPVIDFMLSNTWNSSQYLAQTNPNIQFVYNATFKENGQNSTATQPTIVSKIGRAHV